jgi:hypothetical protein
MVPLLGPACLGEGTPGGLHGRRSRTDVLEEKYYAVGVGTVLELKVRGDDERVELVEHTTAP